MATRLNKRQTDSCRSAIQTRQLINRLQDHVLNGSEMTMSQIRAAEGLLKKSLPDLSSIEMTGEDGGPMVVEVVRFADKTAK